MNPSCILEWEHERGYSLASILTLLFLPISPHCPLSSLPARSLSAISCCSTYSRTKFTHPFHYPYYLVLTNMEEFSIAFSCPDEPCQEVQHTHSVPVK